MLGEVSVFVVGLALACALYAAFATYWGIRQGDSRWGESGRNGVYATAGLLALATGALLAAFWGDQFRIQYVARHSSRALPLYLKTSAVWAGQEGSLLLWALLQALVAVAALGRASRKTRPLVPWASVVLNIVTAFFTAVTLFLSNPFAQLASVPPDGQGMNPLLRHAGMVFHPPALYLGYVGLAVPFAFAMAALITRRVDQWPAEARRWTLASWLFLGIGLFLGARWAYDVLGWGGYWGWDPVENAGLMPWLTASALLHSTVMQEQRSGFRWWNLLMAVFSFALVLFGTFTTRSGLIQSVHAFGRSNLGPYFLAAIGLTLVGSLVLMVNRRSLLASSPSTEGLFSRQGMFFLTLILLVTITASVLIGSLLPTLTEALTGQRFEAGPAWFDRVVGPQLGGLVLVMGLCPLLGTAAAALGRLRGRGLPALFGGALVPAAAAMAGFTRPVSLIGFGVIGLAGATTVAEYVRDAAAVRRRLGSPLLQSFWSLFGRNRRKYGGYLVHAGVILMALGIVGTRGYPFEEELVLSPGEPVDVGRYTLVYDDLKHDSLVDSVKSWASVSVYRDREYLATLGPQMSRYPAYDQTVAVPAVRPGLREDLYLVLAGWEGDGATVTLKVFVNSLASFLWLGGLVFLAGGAVALWPEAKTRRAPAPKPRQRLIGAVGLASGTLILIATAAAMWGPGLATASQSVGRPLPGQPVPDFSLDLLDGSTYDLAQFRGQVVVANFWATWCPPCEDEMPDLQTVWEEYSPGGTAFVGIAYQDEEEAVREMAARFGVSYPLGMDDGDRISAAYGITGVPETYVIDAEGRLAYFHIGPVTARQLRGELDSLLGE